MDTNAFNSVPELSSTPVKNKERNTQQNLGLFFNRCVSSVENFSNHLQCCKTEIGAGKHVNSRTIKFQFVRFLFLCFDYVNRIFSHDHKNVTIHKKTELNYIDQTQKKDYQKVTVSISDEMLMHDLNPEQTQFFVKNETRPIFDKNSKPSPFDVMQSDTRSSCYFISMLSSFVSTDKTSDLLSTKMIEDLGNGTAKVSFVNEQYQIHIDVVIEISQLITNDGDTVYSINEMSDTSWSSLLEKAYHGLKIFLKNSMKDNSFLESTGLSSEKIYELRTIILQSMTGSMGKAENSLDFGRPVPAATWLPRVPKCEQITGLEQVDDTQGFMLTKDTDCSMFYEKAVRTMFENAKLGIPMNVSSKSEANAFDKIRIGFEGMPLRHSMAVVGAATEKTANGNTVDGLIIYDQYARPLPSKELRKAMENGTDIPINIRNSESCIKFIPLKDMHKYFEESVIVAGGFKIKTDTPSI